MKLSHLSLAVFSAIALAACGGSSNDQTTIKKDPPKEIIPGGDDNLPSSNNTLDPVATSLLNNNNIASAAPGTGGLGPFYRQVFNVTMPADTGTAKTTPRNRANDALGRRQLRTEVSIYPGVGPAPATSQNAFIKNADLVDGQGRLPSTFTAGLSQNVYYKDSAGLYRPAFARKDPAHTAATDPVFYYAVDATGAATGSPLKADDLYQIADWVGVPGAAGALMPSGIAATGERNNTFTSVEGFKVFGQTLPNPSRQQTKIDRSKIELRKVVKSDVDAQVEFVSTKLAPGAATQVIQADSDGVRLEVRDTKDFNIGFVKAYNLPHSLTTISMTSPTQQADGPYFNTFYQQGVTQVAGLRTLELPQKATATYTGKVFAGDTEADLSMDVEFGLTNAAYVQNVKITNRKGSLTDQKDMVNIAPAAVNYQGQGANNNRNTYNVDLIAADGINAPAPEYQSMGGQFYGPNAEETAGTMYQGLGGDTAGAPAVSGAYAAERGALTSK